MRSPLTHKLPGKFPTKPKPILTNLTTAVKVAANISQATLLAEGTVTTDILSQADQQSMVFVKERYIRGQIIHKQGLIGCIAPAIRCQADAVDNATGISVNNKDRLISRIKQYRIGGLLSNAPDGKKLLAKLVSTAGKKFTQVILAVFTEKASQSLELACLSIIVNAGTDEDR